MRRLNRPLLFVVDGYNECAAPDRPSLTRALAALARRYEANLLLTSQCPLARSDLLPLHTVEVPPATPETKSAIARNVTGGDALPSELEYLLDAVATGLEARLIGEAGQQISPGSSRYALFDAFARKRLDDMASDGIRLLSQVAGWLSERVAFSLSVRDLDRLIDLDCEPHATATQLRTAGLLTQRGDRISFAHEMFFPRLRGRECGASRYWSLGGGSDGTGFSAARRPQGVHRRCDRRRSPARPGLGRVVGPSIDCCLFRRCMRTGSARVGGGALRVALGASSRGGARGELPHLGSGLDERRLRGSNVDSVDGIGTRPPGRDAAADCRGPLSGRGPRHHWGPGLEDRRGRGPPGATKPGNARSPSGALFLQTLMSSRVRCRGLPISAHTCMVASFVRHAMRWRGPSNGCLNETVCPPDRSTCS